MKVTLTLGSPNGKKIAAILLAILLIGGIGYTSYLYLQTKQMLQNPENAAKQEKKALVAQLSSYMLLPNEDPTLATVSDKTQLSSQAFFTNAENGDKVLLFTHAKKAILYRPSINKIVEIAPIAVSNNAVDATQSLKTSAKVAIYNGTKIAGLAGTTEKKLNELLPNLVVVEKGNTVADYSKTLVVDLSGGHDAIVKELTKVFNGQAGSFPEAEVRPSADIVIIIGK